MEETTESTETDYSEGSFGGETEQAVETSTETDDVSYEDYKENNFDIPTQDDGEDGTDIEETEEYSEDDINAAMMEYLQENFEMPDKFKDVGALISSYKHLEGKMGSVTGAPETYEIEEGVFENYSDTVLEGITKTARDLGLNNDGLNKLLNSAMASDGQEKAVQWEMEKQKMGVNAEAELRDSLQYLNANYSPEISETIQGMIQTSEQFYAMRDIIKGNQSSAPASNQSQQSTGQSDSDIQKMLFAKDSNGNIRMEMDSEYAAKVNQLMKSNW